MIYRISSFAGLFALVFTSSGAGWTLTRPAAGDSYSQTSSISGYGEAASPETPAIYKVVKIDGRNTRILADTSVRSTGGSSPSWDGRCFPEVGQWQVLGVVSVQIECGAMGEAHNVTIVAN